MSKSTGFIPTWLRRKDEWEGLSGSGRALWYWKGIKDGSLPVSRRMVQAADLFYKWKRKYKWCPKDVDAQVARVEDFYLPDGDKFDKFTCIPWQSALIAVMYGFQDKDGNRACNEVLVVIPRKQGKSSLVAALALLECAHPYGGARSPRVCLTGISMDIAKVAYERVEGIVSYDLAHNRKRGFAGRMRATVMSTKCTMKKSRGTIIPLSLAARSLQGYLNFMICVDELSDIPDTKPIDTLRKGMGFSENTILVMTSTEGERRTNALALEVEKAERVLDGEEGDLGRFPMLYRTERDELDQEGEPELWERVAPSLGWAEPVKYYQDTYEAARHDPIDLDEFRTKLLCSSSQADAKFIGVDEVKDTPDPPPDPPRDLCDRWFIGLDPADYNDFAALVLLGVNMKSGRSYVYPEFFCAASSIPGDKVVTRKAQRIRDAEAQGYIQVHGDHIDQAAIADRLIHLYNKYRPTAVLSDPYQAIQEVQEFCKAKGAVHVAKRIRKLPKSGMVIQEPLIWMVQQVKQGHMQVAKNPVLLDHVDNTILRETMSGARIPDKISKESLKKIDGVDAWLMACLGYTRSIEMARLGTPDAPIPPQYERNEQGEVTGVKPSRPVRALGGR